MDCDDEEDIILTPDEAREMERVFMKFRQLIKCRREQSIGAAVTLWAEMGLPALGGQLPPSQAELAALLDSFEASQPGIVPIPIH